MFTSVWHYFSVCWCMYSTICLPVPVDQLSGGAFCLFSFHLYVSVKQQEVQINKKSISATSLFPVHLLTVTQPSSLYQISHGPRFFKDHISSGLETCACVWERDQEREREMYKCEILDLKLYKPPMNSHRSTCVCGWKCVSSDELFHPNGCTIFSVEPAFGVLITWMSGLDIFCHTL